MQIAFITVTTWTLIVGYPLDKGLNTWHLPDYPTEQACRQVGREWQKNFAGANWRCEPEHQVEPAHYGEYVT